MSSSTPHTLYLCYFGLREPLVQTQVLPYLREIKKIDDLKVSLLTFEPDFKEKWTAEQIEVEKKKLAGENRIFQARSASLCFIQNIMFGRAGNGIGITELQNSILF